MIKKTTLLSSAFAMTLSSTTPVTADSHSLAELQNTIPTAILDTALSATDGTMECMKIDDSTAVGWNIGEICLAADIDTSTTDFSSTTNPRAAALKTSPEILGDISTPGAECVSSGGAATTTDVSGGFCMAADISTSVTDFASFSFANALPVTGMQFLQATFGDGSTLSASAPISAECIAVGGSTSATGNGEGFCLVSDLTRSITEFASFSVANGLPVVSLQFLQVTFATIGSVSSSGTGCTSVGGSVATSEGFCLASDLNTSTTGFANFSVAFGSPVANLQFLHLMFGEGSLFGESLPSPGAGAPTGAECISVDGSIAAIGNPGGFCLVSDLIESSTSSANMTIANDLPVSGLQFLQATFADSGSSAPPSPDGDAAMGSDCISADGSVATAGNADGFCLVSDLINSTIGAASFSVANDLPVTAWEFIQVPSEDATPVSGSSDAPDAGAPTGIISSDFMALPFDLRFPSAQADSVSSRQSRRLFHLSDQTMGMEVDSTPYWRRYPNIALWPGR